MAQTVSRLIGEYLTSVPAKSRPGYRHMIDMWLQWCSDNDLDLLRVRRCHIEAYKVWRIERLGLKPSTVATELSPICCLYEYLWQERVIDRNPAEHVKRPKLRRWSDGSWLTTEQAAKLLDLAEADRRAFVGAACCLLLLNGLRAGEVLNLDVADYRRVDGAAVVHVNRKAGWMQDVGLAERTVSAVDRAVGKRESGPLLVYRSKRVPHSMLTEVVADLGARAGAQRRITPHSLRRTFATEARCQGVPDREIMASGGWSTREMIDRYDMGRLAVDNNASRTVENALRNKKN